MPLIVWRRSPPHHPMASRSVIARLTASPAAAVAALVWSACAGLVSTSSRPSPANQEGAPEMTRRWTSRPSGPPSSAIQGLVVAGLGRR